MNSHLDLIFKKWQLSNIRPFMHLAMTNNYVVIVYSDQYKKDVVFKLGSKKVIDREIQALQYFQGDGCVKLLQFDSSYVKTSQPMHKASVGAAADKHTILLQDQTALLLEYLQPGNSLKDLFLQGQEDATIEIFADVIKKIHRHHDQKFNQKFDVKYQTVAERMKLLHTFQSKNEDLVKLLPQAVKLADKLITSQDKKYLLHGDLHHENILQQGDSWVMIDPQGVVGELAFEIGAFIRNPLFELLEQNNLEALILHRFERLSQFLNLDKQRIVDWSFVQAVLAACYSEQDHNDKGQNYFIAVAQLIEKL